ncbi:MAG: TRAP-type C4-dicarboxylate transport system substrate-binding protein [Alphaproteobacteria bacterium]|jgi:TRAP-type C4-dicarboxylate transport system substrate-binding protein
MNVKTKFSMGFLIAGMLTASSVASAETTLRVNMWPSPKHNVIASMVVPWTKQVEQATNGRVKFELSAAPLAGGSKIFDAVDGGIADVSFATTGYLPARFTTSRIVELPLRGESAEALSIAYWRVHDKHFRVANEYKGVELLGVFSHGPAGIHTRETVIGEWSTLKGMKMRVAGGYMRELASIFGVAAVFVPAPDIYGVVSKGTVDGVFFPPETPLKFKVQKFLSNYMQVPNGLYNSAFMFVMNDNAWDALPDQDKAAILKVSGENIARTAGRNWDERDAAALKKYPELGVKVYSPTPKMMEELRGFSDDLEQRWVEDVAKKGIDGKAALEMLAAEVKQVLSN